MLQPNTSSNPAQETSPASVDTANKTSPSPAPGPRTASKLLNLFSWVISGLSVLNLLRNLTPLNLYGRFAQWIHAYTQLVALIAKPLFGWVNWRWMSVDSIDAHILVIALMFCSALARASTEVQMKDGKSRLHTMIGAWTASLVVVFLPALLAVIVLQKPIDMITGTAIVLFPFIFLGLCMWSKIAMYHQPTLCEEN